MVYKRAKIFIIVFLIIFVIYFTQDFTLINIEKTALIVTLGVDKTEEGFTVTSQIAVPEGSKNQNNNNEAVISSDGKTVYEAVSNISDRTGWYPKLSFCNLIVLGESMLEDNVMEVVDFFIRSYKVEDSAILCACEGSAKELLLSSSPLDNISGISLSKIFVKDYEGASKVLPTSIKEFCSNYYSKSSHGYMPYIKTVLTDESGIGGKTSTASSSSTKPSTGKSSGGGEGGGQQKLVIYDATRLLLFDKGYSVGMLSGDEILCYSLLYKGVNESFINVVATDSDGKTGNVLMNVLRTLNKVEFKLKDEKPKLYLNLKVWARISDTDFNESMSEISNIGRLNDNMKFKLKSEIESNILKVIETSKKSKCDIFEIKNLLYKYYPRKYDDNNVGLLDKIEPVINIEVYNYI